MANSERESVQQSFIDKKAIALDAFNLRSDAQRFAIDEKAGNARQAATPDVYLTKVGNDWLASGCELTDTGQMSYINCCCCMCSYCIYVLRRAVVYVGMVAVVARANSID